MSTKQALPIIIPVHDRASLFEQTIRTAIEHAAGLVYPIVIDDCSGEDIQSCADQWLEKTGGRYYRMNRQSGPSICRTFGASLAPTDHPYLYFSDSDVYFEPDWDATLLTAIASLPEFGILSGLRSEHKSVLATHGHRDGTVEEIEDCGAVSMLIARNDWTRLGPFKAQKMNVPSEDIDLCKRFRAADMLIGAVTPAVVIHTGMTSSFWNSSGWVDEIFRHKLARPEILFA